MASCVRCARNSNQSVQDVCAPNASLYPVCVAKLCVRRWSKRCAGLLQPRRSQCSVALFLISPQKEASASQTNRITQLPMGTTQTHVDAEPISAAATRRVCAVIVTYFPDSRVLEDLLRVIAAQVHHVLVIDNGSSQRAPFAADVDAGNLTLLGLQDNVGLAAAQNMGADWARREGFSHILLLDQDSSPDGSMVEQLLSALADLEQRGVSVAAVGPRIIDARTHKQTPFIQFGLPLNRKYPCAPPIANTLVQTSFLVASGMLIPLDRFDVVGPFDEGLFIDNVDMEWCFRAAHTGYGVFGCCSTSLTHRLGERAIEVWPRGWATIYWHPPIRQYYITRNRLALYKKPETPVAWLVQDLLRALFKILYFPLFVKPRLTYARLILRGISDGIRGITGPYTP